MFSGIFQFGRASIAAVVCSVLVATASTASADTLTFNFTGTISDLFFFDGDPPELQIGDPVFGSFAFDGNDSDNNSASTHGYYLHSMSITHVTIGSLTWNLTGGNVLVVNDTSDRYLVEQASNYSGSGPKVDGMHAEDWSMTLHDSDGTYFADDSLPQTPPTLSAFEDREMTIRFAATPEPPDFDFRDGEVRATVDSLTIVPEPASLSLLAVGALALIKRKR